MKKSKFNARPAEEKERSSRAAELHEKIVAGCDRLGGFAQIGENHVVVDTRKFRVTPAES